MVRRGTLEVDFRGDIYIGSQAFKLWIFDQITKAVREDLDFEQWLSDKEYKLGGLLPQEEINWLQTTWQKIPKGTFDLARQLISSALGSWTFGS